MKAIISILMLIGLFPGAIFAQKYNFQIEGKSPAGLKKVYLLCYDYQTDGVLMDSVLVKNNSFSFQGKIDGATYAGLYFKESLNSKVKGEVKDFWFYINPGKTIVDASVGPSAKIIDGGELTKVYLNYQKELAEKNKKFSSAAYLAYNDQINSLKMQMDSLAKERDVKFGSTSQSTVEHKIEFIKHNPTNSLSLVYLEQLAGNKTIQVDIKGLLESLSNDLLEDAKAKKIAAMLNADTNLIVGGKAIPFEQQSSDGKLIRLTDYRGKYVLLDFWASWCAPCRQESPHLVKAYEKYKSKNFDVLAVSLDSNKESWLKAIKDDGLNWKHVSDLKGWKNSVSILYAVRAVPTNYLIDPNGVIVAKDLRGEELEIALEKLLK